MQVLMSWCAGKRRRNIFDDQIRLHKFANTRKHNCDIQLGQCLIEPPQGAHSTARIYVKFSEPNFLWAHLWV